MAFDEGLTFACTMFRDTGIAGMEYAVGLVIVIMITLLFSRTPKYWKLVPFPIYSIIGLTTCIVISGIINAFFALIFAYAAYNETELGNIFKTKVWHGKMSLKQVIKKQEKK